MKRKPAFKTARRLGAPIFEKTQTQKYAAWEEKKYTRNRRGSRKSEYGKQMIEKQKARLMYGLSEKQFRSYIDKAMSMEKPAAAVYDFLERRLDNIAYRLGLAPTRQAARQLVSHGHLVVNGKKTMVPSQRMNQGDTFTVREGSQQKKHLLDLSPQSIAWVSFDDSNMSGEITGSPDLANDTLMFDLDAIIEFYNR